MGLWDKLRKLRPSHGRDSYSQYKGRREVERRERDHARERAGEAAERKREKAERERGYEERYRRERESDTGSE